jgi:hypothetical protein
VVEALETEEVEIASLDFNSPATVSPGAFSYINPSELQFSCNVTFHPQEENCSVQLACENPAKRLEAAQALWRGHSRRHAADVITFAQGPRLQVAGFDRFAQLVKESLTPVAILKELQTGDYEWGAWLAFLEPDKELVPELIAALETQPKYRDATAIALGKSKDPRALKPLLKLLKSDYVSAGFAADGLAYLADPAAESALIDALKADRGWMQACAAGALAKIGSAKAIPELERLANDKSYTGAIDVDGAAQRAIDAIKVRSKTGK